MDLREKLAHVYRLQGDLVQAGRWTYLADERARAQPSNFEPGNIATLAYRIAGVLSYRYATVAI
jgi:hypothetical protein